MNRRTSAVILFSLLPGIWLSAQANPFITGTPATPQTVQPAGKLMPLLMSLQREFRTEMTAMIQELKDGSSAALWISLLGLSFLYGLVHALGPGHRKTVLFSYFLSRKAKPRHGMAAGYTMALLHAGAAFIIVCSIYYILQVSLTRTFNDTNLLIEKVSYMLLTLMGVGLLIHSIFSCVSPKSESSGKEKKTGFWMILVSAGLIPCPGAAAILIFALGQKILIVGALSVFAMSLGMGTSISIISVLTIIFRDAALKTLNRKKKLQTAIEHGVEIAGAVILILFSLFLLIPLL